MPPAYSSSVEPEARAESPSDLDPEQKLLILLHRSDISAVSQKLIHDYFLGGDEQEDDLFSLCEDLLPQHSVDLIYTFWTEYHEDP
jgi:hypothetical protein